MYDLVLIIYRENKSYPNNSYLNYLWTTA